MTILTVRLIRLIFIHTNSLKTFGLCSDEININVQCANVTCFIDTSLI